MLGHNLNRLGLQIVANWFQIGLFNQPKINIRLKIPTKYFEYVNIETKNLEIIYGGKPSLTCKTIITSDPNRFRSIYRSMNFNLYFVKPLVNLKVLQIRKLLNYQTFSLIT